MPQMEIYGQFWMYKFKIKKNLICFGLKWMKIITKLTFLRKQILFVFKSFKIDIYVIEFFYLSMYELSASSILYIFSGFI